MTLLSPLGHQLPKQWKALTSVACCKSISVKKNGHKSCFWRPPGVIGSVVEEREWGLIQHSVKDAGWDGGTATEVIVQPFIKQWKERLTRDMFASDLAHLKAISVPVNIPDEITIEHAVVERAHLLAERCPHRLSCWLRLHEPKPTEHVLTRRAEKISKSLWN